MRSFLLAFSLLVFIRASAQTVVSETVNSADCTIKEGESFNIINTTVSGGSGGCLEVKATDYIDLTDYFDSELGSNFDARIIGGITTPVNPDPPTNPSTPENPYNVPDDQKTCENLENHGITNPHLYADGSSNQMVGNLISYFTPQYRIEGLTDWKLMKTSGYANTGTDLKFHYFEEPADQTGRNIILRTKEGCPEYRDVRLTKVYNNTLEEWFGLPLTISPLQPSSALDLHIFPNSLLEGRSLQEDLVVFSFFTNKNIPNLELRINGSHRMGFQPMTYNYFSIREDFPKMESGVAFPKKDFYLDISNDGFETAARYTVYRNYLGGHWSTVSTLTRHDNRVTVSAQGLNWDADQVLYIPSLNKSFRNIPEFGNVFDLGFLPDGDYIGMLQTHNGVTVHNRIMIRVKRPIVN